MMPSTTTYHKYNSRERNAEFRMHHSSLKVFSLWACRQSCLNSSGSTNKNYESSMKQFCRCIMDFLWLLLRIHVEMFFHPLRLPHSAFSIIQWNVWVRGEREFGLLVLWSRFQINNVLAAASFWLRRYAVSSSDLKLLYLFPLLGTTWCYTNIAPAVLTAKAMLHRLNCLVK